MNRTRLTRRSFLRLTVAAAAGAGLSACGATPKLPAPTVVIPASTAVPPASTSTLVPAVPALLAQVSVDRMSEHIRSLEGVRHPGTDPEALERAAVYVDAALKSLQYNVEPHFFTYAAARQYRNIIATRLGVRSPEERVLVTAHYDTKGYTPGADDNASGVAALLEIARVLNSVAFERTVQFVALNLEELGYCGSQALASDAAKQGWKIEGMINFDTIAYAGKQIPQASPVPSITVPEFGDFIAVVGNAASAGLVEMFVQAIGHYQIALPAVPLVVPGNGETIPDARRSDHASFWDAGYKAVMLTDTAESRSPHYHQATDTLATLNMPFAADVCRAALATVVDMARYAGVG
jgi:Zn-dependent M28 family amino/carboxypeptidase